MAGRDYLPYGVPGRTPGERAREGSRADPRRPTYQQTTQSVSEDSSYVNTEYNQIYDNNDRYVNNSEYFNNGDPYNYEYLPAQAEDTVRDFNYFQEYHNEEPTNYDYVYSNTNSNKNSGNKSRKYYDSNNNQVDKNQPYNFSDIDMRENIFENHNSVEDKRRFQNFDNFQDEESHPVTIKNVRDIIEELLTKPQPDRHNNNNKIKNNSVHGRDRNYARPPSPRPGSSRGPSEDAGGTGVARSHERDYFPERPEGLLDSEWRAMCNSLIQTREACGAIPPIHKVNFSCPSPSLLDDAEEYMDENEDEQSDSGSSI